MKLENERVVANYSSSGGVNQRGIVRIEIAGDPQFLSVVKLGIVYDVARMLGFPLDQEDIAIKASARILRLEIVKELMRNYGFSLVEAGYYMVAVVTGRWTPTDE